MLLFSKTSPFCFPTVFDEITNEWSDGFDATKKPRTMPNRRWHPLRQRLLFCPSGVVAGVVGREVGLELRI
jgi:hypothetical protein